MKVPLFKAFKISQDNTAHLFIQQTVVEHLLGPMALLWAEHTKISKMKPPSSRSSGAVVLLPRENYLAGEAYLTLCLSL